MAYTQLDFDAYLADQARRVRARQNFDAPRARQARDAAIERVDENAIEEWKTAARACIAHCAHTLPEFSTDDVFRRLLEYNVITRDNRAMGPQMIQAAAAGLIAKTNQRVNTERVSRHNTEIAVWRSLVYQHPAH